MAGSASPGHVRVGTSGQTKGRSRKDSAAAARNAAREGGGLRFRQSPGVTTWSVRKRREMNLLASSEEDIHMMVLL